MKFFKYMKDGGPESRVAGFFFAEIKKLFSVVFLRFFDGSREAYHSHAFDAVSWVLKGQLTQVELNGDVTIFKPSLKPIVTLRDTFHKVSSQGETWVFSFRGPWASTWKEYIPETDEFLTLTNGRKIVAKATAGLNG